MIQKLDELLTLAKSAKTKTVAVAQAADRDVLEAVCSARDMGIANSILVGDKGEIETILRKLGQSPDSFTIIHEPDAKLCAAVAVAEVTQGHADFLMKGLLGTSDLMRAVIDKEKGLRTGRTISHTMFYEVPSYSRLICLTDGGMNTFPDLAKKADILENALITCRALGCDSPSCAVVCAAETVDPKIQSTLDAQALCTMPERFSQYNARIFGPCGFDLAISPSACKHKGYTAPGAGEADIILVPTYEVGNGIGKAITYFASASSAGIIVGARVPIVLVSRSDTSHTKLLSIALAAVM